MTPSNDSGLGEAELKALVDWWRSVNSDKASGSARADRAVLRRAGSVQDVIFTPAYHRVHAALEQAHGGRWSAAEEDRIAAIVGLSAHVKRLNELSLPAAMSERPKDIDRNRVSELRFRRLLDSADIDTLFVGLRRTLPLIDHAVRLESLAKDVFYWGDIVKKRWAYGYNWSKAQA